MLGTDVGNRLQEVCGSQELLLPLSYVPALVLPLFSHVWLRIELQSYFLILFSSKTHLFSWAAIPRPEDRGLRVAVLASVVSGIVILAMSLSFLICCLQERSSRDRARKEGRSRYGWRQSKES